MPLRPPRLDDRGFDDLVAELLARIPAHTPEWTNPRVGDPGRTLIELFAWLGDTLLYRANLIPERQRLVFLKLLGIEMRPAVPARGVVALRLDTDTLTPPVTFRAGARVKGPPLFETRGEVTVLPLEARVYAKRLLDEATHERMRETVRELTQLYQALRPDAAGRAPLPYVSHEVFAGGAPAPAGFDLATETVDKALWIALLAPEPELAGPARTMLREGQDGRPFTVNVGYVPAVAAVERLEELPRRRPIAHVWEVLTGESLGVRPVFRALDVLRDSTGGLLRDGVLQLALASGSFGVPDNDVRRAPAAGSGDLPPRIDDPEDALRLVAWLRLRPTERLGSLPVTWIGLNAVEIEQASTVREVIAGTGDGRADQIHALPATSVDPGSLRLQVEEGDRGFVPWQRVDDLAAHGRDDRVYLLDAEAGRVRFGDGLRGQVPRAGSRVRVLEMRAGGGAAGNLPPGTLSEIRGEAPDGSLIGDPIEVLQRLPTRGGADAESIAQAEQRIPAVLKHRNRAVTEEDFRVLAATTPGVRVGRVEVLPRFKPQQRRQNVPGVVSVLVIPAQPRAGFQAPAPRPDRPFVEGVHGWLDERRPLGTELYVIGPEYVALGASVGVDIRDGFEREATLAAVRLAVRAFVWPLPPGGPLGLGWVPGAAVTAPQAEVAVARVPGVAAVRGLRLFNRRGDDWVEASAAGGGVRLERWQMPELLSLVVVAGADPPTDLSAVPNPFRQDGLDGLPLPVVPEVC